MIRWSGERLGIQARAHRRRAGRAVAAGLVTAVVLGLPTVVSAAWHEPVGGVRPISDIGGNPSFASVGGVPYVAWDRR